MIFLLHVLKYLKYESTIFLTVPFLSTISVANSQCRNSRFYVKSNLAILGAKKLQFWHFLSLCNFFELETLCINFQILQVKNTKGRLVFRSRIFKIRKTCYFSVQTALENFCNSWLNTGCLNTIGYLSKSSNYPINFDKKFLSKKWERANLCNV